MTLFFFLRRSCYYLLLSTTTITAFHKGGSILAFIVHVYERALLACGFCHLRYIYNLKEKSELLFNLYVWFYFLCVIKRKIVAAIAYNNQTKIQWRIDHVACTVRLFVCLLARSHTRARTQVHLHIDRETIRDLHNSVLFCLRFGYGELDLVTRKSGNEHTDKGREKRRRRKIERRAKERMKESKPSRRWYTVDGVFHPSMNQNE